MIDRDNNLVKELRALVANVKAGDNIDVVGRLERALDDNTLQERRAVIRIHTDMTDDEYEEWLAALEYNLLPDLEGRGRVLEVVDADERSYREGYRV